MGLANCSKEYRRAIELNPNYATAHHWYAEHLMWQGASTRRCAKANERATGSTFTHHCTDNGAILYFSRQYDRAIEQCHTVLRKDPNFARAAGIIVYAYVEKGMFEQALADEEILRRFYGEGPWHWSFLAYIMAARGSWRRLAASWKNWKG